MHEMVVCQRDGGTRKRGVSRYHVFMNYVHELGFYSDGKF